MIEIFAPSEYVESVKSFLDEQEHHGLWTDQLSDDRCLVRVLVSTESTETVIDVMESRFSNVDGFRLMLFAVEATVPRPQEKKTALPEGEAGAKAPSRPVMRISREELYEDLHKGAQLSKHYLVMLVLSTVVVAVGLIRDNPAVTIGAMVIAPLLGPNMALALATTLADHDLSRRALKATFVGILLALSMALLLGLATRFFPGMMEIHPQGEIYARTSVGWWDIVLALAAGGAGAVAFTAGFATTLVGVMVAVALLPPLVTTGLLLGHGHEIEGLRALLLFFVNLICVNLAGVMAFWIEGIRPKRWWEAQKAKRATVRAVGIWCFLLLAASGLVVLNNCTKPEIPMDDRGKRARISELYASYIPNFPGVPSVEVGEYRGSALWDEAVLVDVRPESERAVSMIPGALDMETFEGKIDKLEGRKIVCYCTIGFRSGLYARKLRERGLDASNLEGGILSWLHGGGKLRDDSGETRRVHVYGSKWDLAPSQWRTQW
ncbi:MAG: TIGR00341 family protein [Planctomycetota bacterium]|jgi:uncharacterized hydrophobic protein (TIGR00341 family)